VALIGGLAQSAEAGPQGVACDRAEGHRAIALVVNGDQGIDVLEVMVRAYVAIVVRRNVARADDGLVVVIAGAVEREERIRHRTGRDYRSQTRPMTGRGRLGAL